MVNMASQIRIVSTLVVTAFDSGVDVRWGEEFQVDVW